MRIAVCSAFAAGLAIACGGNGDVLDGGADGSVDSTSDVKEAGADAMDAAADVPIDNWVAPLKPFERMPVMGYGGGRLLTAPKIVTVSFAGDDANLIGRLQEFDDTITQTPWWTASTAEYCENPPKGPCIGPGSSGGHVVLNETAASSYVDHEDGKNSTIVQFIQAHITSGAFPPPDDQTIYMIFFPSGTNISLDGSQSCNSFGAYHFSAKFDVGDAGATISAAYGIEPRCNYNETFLTQAASHELIEAATDTDYPNGYNFYDDAWCRYGCEVGDLCDHPWGGIYDTMTLVSYDGGAPYTLQRGWSDVSSLAGHDPCVIPPSDHPYFNTAVESGKQKIYLSVGESTTIELDGFADGTMPDWTIAASDQSGPILGASTSLTFSLDKTTMNNGQTAHLTITLTKAPQYSYVPYVIDNKDANGHEHQWGASVYLQ